MLLPVMKIRILPFGVLKDWLGASQVELAEGATVADLLEQLSAGPAARLLRGIAVSVNAEYARPGQVLCEDDEVGLLPPVSGGSNPSAASAEAAAEPLGGSSALTREPIEAEKLIAAAKRGEDGAVVVFDGVVRNNSRGRQTLYLDYEAYEEMAARQMDALTREALSRFGVREVKLLHRLGRLMVGETSILIVVASAHRGAAFEACRWLIDTLKKTVPIWKKETFVDGAVWAAGEPFPAGLGVDAAEASHDA
jgi:molybdopterin synthase catalytic subunit